MVRVRLKQPTASGRREGWIKTFTKLDRSVRGSKAFLGGQYLRNDTEYDLDVGTLVLYVYPTGSVKNGEYRAKLCRVSEDPGPDDDFVSPVDRPCDFSWVKEFLSLLDRAEALLQEESS